MNFSPSEFPSATDRHTVPKEAVCLRFIMILMLFITSSSCSTSEDEKLIQQSIEVHEEALNIGLKIRDKITGIEQQAQALEEPMSSVIKDSVEVLRAELNAWEATIIEVPGNEDHHHDHHGHRHEHRSPSNLTPEMVLEIQQDIKKRALSLSERAQHIIDNF